MGLDGGARGITEMKEARTTGVSDGLDQQRCQNGSKWGVPPVPERPFGQNPVGYPGYPTSHVLRADYLLSYDRSAVTGSDREFG